ncbi:MAG: M20/M25/M40 family metallo-hydrolase [Bryobacterales bacterium]|nr:M20/M25/M40 family metallo-hydrolase [Bryobacterales bacterium]MBV9400344.1 M20/M25/M40 family metallo-hydrolase [Bryobacterales bacterium]
MKHAVRFLSTVVLCALTATAEERVDLDTIHRIKTEALENSKVMEHLFYLTDVYGPRVTNSPGFFAAADWVVKQLGEWGIPARLEKWGPYGHGWSYTHFSANLIEPEYAPLIGFPLAFTNGTNGPVTGELVMATLANEKDLENWKGKLRGKIVLDGSARELPLSLQPLARRYTDSDLGTLLLAPQPVPPRPNAQGNGPAGNGQPANAAANRRFQDQLAAFLREEAPAVVVRGGSGRSDDGTVFGQGGQRDPKQAPLPPMVVLTPEHYNRLVRLVDHNIPVKVEFDIETHIDDRTDSVNVIGQIDGGRKKDEVVMIGAHLDSWQGGTGATDNAAGSAVMIEAMRILKTLNLKLDRSVRIGLWSGEEEGLLGSRAYVKEHFGDRETMKLGAEQAKLSGYFNVDNGSGRIRGVYLQGNDMMRPVFDAWLKPFADMGVSTISIRNTTGTDHLSFNEVGLPGFQFIQDPLEYDSLTHHSNMDVYDHVQGGDLMQAAAIVTSVIYHAANREEMLPRPPLPKPQPPQRDGTDNRSNPPSN